MDGWLVGWTDEWVDGWMDGWMDGLMHPSIHPSIHSSTHPSIHQSINPSIHSSTHQSIHQSVHPFIHPFICFKLLSFSIVDPFTFARTWPNLQFTLRQQVFCIGVSSTVEKNLLKEADILIDSFNDIFKLDLLNNTI